ncbi:MAG: Radical domain protein [Firmicutes bacterium]|nr:Radical domain protein [Bacillota bacterium]
MNNGELKAWSNAGSKGCCQPQVAAVEARKARTFVAKRWAAPQKAERRETDNKDEKCGNDINVGSMDAFLDRVETYSFCISGMAFQDVWNLDLDRLRECFIHVVSPDSRIIPFCAYNLTDKQGNSLYRP